MESTTIVCSPEGVKQVRALIDFYMANAHVIRDGLGADGFTVYGGRNAPYIWFRTPAGMASWDFFDRLLAEAQVVGAPAAGFGPSGEGISGSPPSVRASRPRKPWTAHPRTDAALIDYPVAIRAILDSLEYRPRYWIARPRLP